MNERIKELVEQCHHRYSDHQIDIEKYTELIIRECAGLTLDYINNQHYNGWLDYRDEILKHFGVKE